MAPLIRTKCSPVFWCYDFIQLFILFLMLWFYSWITLFLLYVWHLSGCNSRKMGGFGIGSGPKVSQGKASGKKEIYKKCERTPSEKKKTLPGRENRAFAVYVKGQREYHCLCSEIHTCNHRGVTAGRSINNLSMPHKHQWNQSLWCNFNGTSPTQVKMINKRIHTTATIPLLSILQSTDNRV